MRWISKKQVGVEANLVASISTKCPRKSNRTTYIFGVRSITLSIYFISYVAITRHKTPQLLVSLGLKRAWLEFTPCRFSDDKSCPAVNSWLGRGNTVMLQWLLLLFYLFPLFDLTLDILKLINHTKVLFVSHTISVLELTLTVFELEHKFVIN